MSPATVDTCTENTAVRNTYQRRAFYAAGQFWAFYSDATNAVDESTDIGQGVPP